MSTLLAASVTCTVQHQHVNIMLAISCSIKIIMAIDKK